MAVIEAIQTMYLEVENVTIMTFSSIPSTYEHLQLRVSTHDTHATGTDQLFVRLNNDTTSYYSSHHMQAYSGAGKTGSATTRTSLGYWGDAIGGNNLAGEYSTVVIDIQDYANTNKSTVLTFLSGSCPDADATKSIKFGSSLWESTTTVSEIDVYCISSAPLQRGTSGTLYGIRSS